jgi:hypothetical protein
LALKNFGRLAKQIRRHGFEIATLLFRHFHVARVEAISIPAIGSRG